MAIENRKIYGSSAEKIVFLQKKCILTYPMQLGVLGRFSAEPYIPGPSRRISEIFRPARFFKLRKREIPDKYKSFCRFCSFSVDEPIHTGQL